MPLAEAGVSTRDPVTVRLTRRRTGKVLGSDLSARKLKCVAENG